MRSIPDECEEATDFVPPGKHPTSAGCQCPRRDGRRMDPASRFGNVAYPFLSPGPRKGEESGCATCTRAHLARRAR
ncbi:hypothetical protein C8034_v008520 [Colletotrichum sidae]|uniref:Uncharacterized protein n=1 Tax=Colletotrichum sidae TaxID=1347389 RepID=A0A4R8T2D7_9PEZI|nr:hypothetical protein C8034_v008520 [Colletotrichum sidae]